eukprot:TRINITY_DN1086_c0_g1_i1.p1 TRINITY_DN1086_c0_g1~~TRINITY_DN1086_c0_g1_i1.p1  ORF type:complete len:233 (-),score=107.00 TRINITY_DN1086_c0_g1_i1:47-745(-)
MSTTVKVFAGNLPFSMTEESLAAAFGAAGNVVSATLIVRGTRSLGYGFVEMANEADADAAVAALHQKEFDGRQINVERATSRVTDEELAERANKPRRPRRRRGGRGEGAEGANSNEGGERKARVPVEEREPSKTTVFVANLPFTTTSESLLAAFKAHKATGAVVSCRPNGKSKGFGFVEFAPADVDAGIKAMDNSQLEGREITVRPAVTEFSVENERVEAIRAKLAAAPAAE